MATVVQRLLASHLKHPESQVLVLHTDHLSISRGPCSLLDSMGARPLVLVSPHSVTGLVEKYTSQGIRVAPIISKETSITLRHVLALFTPPAAMKGASSILCTIQLILSQLGEPFDLLRFIDLIDQEKWSEDGANFMALRQTLLMKLLSPLVDAHQYKSQQAVLVDLTDPILWSTGLDSAIMDIALYDFIRSSVGRKLIVLNNCQQYLTQNSNLTKSLKAIAALGNDRPTGIIFSTTDPTVVSSSLLNLVDYVIVGSTRSLQWSNSLRKHFASIDISKKRLRGGRVMIWSPESTSLVQNTSETASQQLWKDDSAFIDIEQLKESMPVIQANASPAGIHSDACIPNGAEEKVNRSPVTRQEVISVEASHECERTGGSEYDEEGLVPLDELNHPSMHPHPSGTEQSTLTTVLSKTVPGHQAARIESSSPLEKTQTIARLGPLIACISQLCSKRPDSQVPYTIVKQEMNSRMDEIRSLGWSDLGMLMEAAYKENVVEPIREKRNKRIKFLRLIPQSPRSLPLSHVIPMEHSTVPTMPCITSIAPEVDHPIGTLAKAMDYPLEHRPVVLTMLTLMSMLGLVIMAPGAGVPMVELAKALGRDFPCREGEYHLIARAEEDGIISMGEYSNSWAYLNSPPNHTAPLTGSSPISPLMSPRILAQDTTLQLTSTVAGTSHDAFEHPLVISAILELTGGAWDIKVRLVDFIASLLRNCSGAEGMVLPLLFQARQAGLTMDDTDAAGVIWVRLRSPPHTGFTALSNYIASPPPELAYSMPNLIPNTAILGGPGPVTSVLEPPTSVDYPLAHREVVATVLKLTRGTVGEKIHVADLASSLAHDFPSPEGPWDLIFQAQDKGILGLVRQNKSPFGVTWAYLKHPHPPVVTPPTSKTAVLTQHVPQSGPIQLPTRIPSHQSIAMVTIASTKQAITARITAPNCPPNHRAVVGALITLTDGTPEKRVRMDEWISSLRGEYPCVREEFLLALMSRAEEDGVMTRGRCQDGVQWVWLNPEKVIQELIPRE